MEAKIAKCWDKYKEEFKVLTSSINDYLFNTNTKTNKVALLKEPASNSLLKDSSIIKTENEVQKMMNFFTKTINST